MKKGGSKTGKFLIIFLLILSVNFVFAASYQSDNFIITANDPVFAQQVAVSAEQYRDELAMQWLGYKFPDWGNPARITIIEGENLGGSGDTSFVFAGGEVFMWRGTWQGSKQELLDYIIYHELLHKKLFISDNSPPADNQQEIFPSIL